MNPIPLPSTKMLRTVLSYDPATGTFTWLAGQNAGSRAGSRHAKGYIIIKIGEIGYKAHRLAWKYVTGEEPGRLIDHQNRNKADNRWDNIRSANNSQNAANSRLRRDNQAGLKGVSHVSGSPKWQARIRKDGKLTYLGIFATRNLAHDAYLTAAKEMHGEFANGGEL